MTRTPIRQHGTVLAGVKALRPFGRPAAGLDPSCGRCNQQGSGAGPQRTNHDHMPLTDVSTVSGDCHGALSMPSIRTKRDADSLTQRGV